MTTSSEPFSPCLARELKAIVDEALIEVLALDERRKALLAEHGVDAAILGDQGRRAAWA